MSIESHLKTIAENSTKSIELLEKLVGLLAGNNTSVVETIPLPPKEKTPPPKEKTPPPPPKEKTPPPPTPEQMKGLNTALVIEMTRLGGQEVGGKMILAMMSEKFGVTSVKDKSLTTRHYVKILAAAKELTNG